MGPERVKSMIIGVVPSALGPQGADGERVAMGTGGGQMKGERVRDRVGETFLGEDNEDLGGAERVAGVICRSRICDWIQAS
jgi:hypothetical protein